MGELVTAIPLFILVIMLLAVWLYSARRQDMARRRLEKQVEDNGIVLEALQLLLQEGPESSFKRLSGLADDAHASVEIYLTLSLLLKAFGELEQSLRLLEILRRRPDLEKSEQERVDLEMGELLLALGRLDEVENLLKPLSSRHPVYNRLKFRMALARGQWSAALKLLKGRKEGAANFILLADKALSAGEEGDALEALKRALKADKGSVGAKVRLGKLWIKRGKSARGRSLLLDVLAENPGLTPTLVKALQDSLDSGSRGLSKYEKLVEEMRAVREMAPWWDLEAADIHFSRGDGVNCRALLKSLLEEHSGNFEVHEAYLNLLKEEGDIEAVFEAMPGFVELAARQMARFHCAECGRGEPMPFLICPSCGLDGGMNWS